MTEPDDFAAIADSLRWEADHYQALADGVHLNQRVRRPMHTSTEPTTHPCKHCGLRGCVCRRGT